LEQLTIRRLLIQVQSIVLRITEIDFGVIKKCTITLDVIVPEPETEGLIRICIEVCYKEVDIDVSSLCLQH